MVTVRNLRLYRNGRYFGGQIQELSNYERPSKAYSVRELMAFMVVITIS